MDDITQQIQSITSLKGAMKDLATFDERRALSLLRRADLAIRKIFGETSQYLEDLQPEHFETENIVDSRKEKGWMEACAEFDDLCDLMIDDLRFRSLERQRDLEDSLPSLPGAPPLQIFNLHERDASQPQQGVPSNEKVFIVHGHDNEMKEAVARTLSSLGLTPIILHEQPDKGRTVIEKFLGHSDVGFAVVLLSPDDLGYEGTESHRTAKPRARQNVILELGYFLGKLGRDRVVALYRDEKALELPSDYAGVLFKPYTRGGHWRFELVKELKACGYKVSADAVC